jgi:hypothetical protein
MFARLKLKKRASMPNHKKLADEQHLILVLHG